jgi:hypothetical protein
MMDPDPDDAPETAARWATGVLRSLDGAGLGTPADPPWLPDAVWNRLRRLAAGEATDGEIADALRAAEAEDEALDQWQRGHYPRAGSRRR